jgi:hypothetical protein
MKRTTLTRPDRAITVTSFVRDKGGPAEPKTISGQNSGCIPPFTRGGYIHPHFPLQQEEKKSTKLSELLAGAESLSPSERKELLARLSLFSLKPTPRQDDRELEMWTQAVYSALERAVGAGSGGGGGPMVLRRLLSASKNWGATQDFMATPGLRELDVGARQSVYMLLAEILVGHAKQLAQHIGAPLGPKFVANCSADVGALFESAFPGYLSSGLVGLVARRRVAGGHH